MSDFKKSCKNASYDTKFTQCANLKQNRMIDKIGEKMFIGFGSYEDSSGIFLFSSGSRMSKHCSVPGEFQQFVQDFNTSSVETFI